jgi:protein ImuB
VAFAAQRLLIELHGFLVGRGAGVDRVTVYLFHRLPLSTRLPLALPFPSQDPDQFLALLQERLKRIVSALPVYEVGLEADTLLPLSEYALGRYGATATEGSISGWGERPWTPLGKSALRHLRAEHCPTAGWRYCPPGASGAPFPAGARPLRLLPMPIPLEQRDCRLWFSGPLSLRSPRLEASGERDYYLAEGPEGDRLWIYRERGGERRWFLDGVFE